MELYQLKTFVIVAEEANLTRASKRLNASQPAVSSHIKALEEEFGVALFYRHPQGMELTPEGEELKKQADTVLREAEIFVFKARQLRGEVAGSVTIGLNSATDLLKTDDFFSFMAERYPKLEFHLLQSISGFILNDIKAAKIDGGYVFGANPYPEDLELLVLHPYKLRVVGPSSWRQEVESADWQKLAELPWIWTPVQCPWRNILAGEFASRNLHPIAVAHTDNERTMSSLVIAGAGMGMMLEAEAEEAEVAGRVVIWPQESFPLTLSFAYLKKRETDPILQATLDGVRMVWGL